MISKISFGSTYKVNNQNQEFKNFNKFSELSSNLNLQSGDSPSGIYTKFEEKFIGDKYIAQETLIVPFCLDEQVESYCRQHNIIYTKLTDEELINPANINERIDDAPKGYKKVYVDNDKLNNLIANQDSNIRYCENDFNEYYYNDIETMLKTGDKIPATTLVINPQSGNIDELERYINQYGVNSLNKNQISVDFDQRTDNPDHCVYFAFKLMNFNKIPVYVDNDTYKAGQILGLFYTK